MANFVHTRGWKHDVAFTDDARISSENQLTLSAVINTEHNTAFVFVDTTRHGWVKHGECVIGCAWKFPVLPGNHRFDGNAVALSSVAQQVIEVSTIWRRKRKAGNRHLFK